MIRYRSMGAPAFDKLHVLVTGIDAVISRDVVRLLAAEGASVIVVDADAGRLARLERDLGLYRLRVEAAAVDLSDADETRLWEDNLRIFGRLPQLMICCCDMYAAQSCPAVPSERILQPALSLHVLPRRRSPLGRALCALRAPTLTGLLRKDAGHGVFSPNLSFPTVRIASQLFSLRRRDDRISGGEATHTIPLRQNRANAA